MVSGMETNSNSNNNVLNTDSNAVPSPQSVGREFVRQYYTILNAGPQLLHRFYSDDSSFVHGGVDKPGEVSVPVYGQDNINKKIMSLNFKDCHAKIRQVDAMETIGKGVVIQVTGELSNDGQPMRKFLQTFVLAPQSSTKYYAKNDIFRYQDDIFVDDDEYSENEKNSEVALEKTEMPTLKSVEREREEKEVKEDPTPSVSADFYENTNGSVHENIDKISVGNEVTDEKPNDLNSSEVFENENYIKGEDFEERNSTSPQLPTNETKTYANMVSKTANANFPPFSGISTFTTVVKTDSTTALSTPFPRPVESSPIPSMAVNNPSTAVPSVTAKPPNNTNNGSQRENRGIRRDQRFNRRNESREITPGRGGLNDSDDDFRDKKQYPDENQVFVGNLPQNINDEDLRTFFGKFGRILDVRINRQNQKMGSNVKTPNYGFVTFDTPEIVQQIIKLKPIYFNDHRFNVEEKRSQSGRGSSSFDRNPNRGSGLGGPGGRLNNSLGNVSGNRSQSGGSAGNQRNRNQFTSGANREGQRGSGGFGGGGGFGPNRNSSFNNRQNR